MFKKILLGLLLFLVLVGISGYFYFTAGSESYPTLLDEGRIAPDFSGTDQTGQILTLSELTLKGPVVLVFYRGLWCPACQKHLEELQTSINRFEENGATVVVITPEKTESTLRNVALDSTSISIIHDEENRIMQAFNVAYQPGTGSQRLLKVMGIDPEIINGQDQYVLPVPAIYVIGKDGRIDFSYEKAGGLIPVYLPVTDILDKLSKQ